MTVIDAMQSPMASSAPVTWAEARWIGVIDLDSAHPPDTERILLAGAERYTHARILVRESGRVRGFVELNVTESTIDPQELGIASAALPPADPQPLLTAFPGITVVICTRDRPDQLSGALTSVLALDYPGEFEILIVDNAPAGDATRRFVADLAGKPGAGPSIRLVTEHRPGLARARNCGLRNCASAIVAFTDDDVIVDPGWLRRLADGFSRGRDVVCVTGMVPSGELRTPVQAYFDRRVSWASTTRGRVFSMARPPADVAMFPFQVGVYGTGANFALLRAAAFSLGGFDEGLGVGSPTGGGEDIDMFVRVLRAGHALAYEPSAVVWHRHRSEIDELVRQARDYGVGLGAWLTRVALDPRLAGLALRRSWAALHRVRSLGARPLMAADESLDPELRAALNAVGRAERSGVLRGPGRYVLARRRGACARPLFLPGAGG